MELTLRQIRYLRLYKQGLIAPFASMAELFAGLEIQAQSENDAYFNVNCRLSRAVSPEQIRQAAIRIWYVRNTVFLMGRDCYPKAVFVNRFLDNWFRRMQLTTLRDENDMNQIADLCRDRDTILVEELLEQRCNERFLRSWSGAFIELVRLGILRSKYQNRLEINRELIPGGVCLEDVMRQYFDHCGPATLLDFKHWFGSAAAQVTQAFANIQGEYLRVNGNMFMPHRDLALLEAAGEIPLIITGKFDPICLNYQEKTWLLPREEQPRVWGKAGIVEAVILQDGQIVATWRRDKCRVKVTPIGTISQDLRQQIEAKFREALDPKAEVFYQVPVERR